MQQQLTSIVQSILVSGTADESISAVKDLSDFFNDLADPLDESVLTEKNEIYVSGGQALSTYHAAVCTNDYLRTAAFLKGVYSALNQLMDDHPDKNIHILYAGCGPFATLLLPLLPLLDKNRIEVLLLDINSESIRAVTNLISAISLGDYNIKPIEANAITYKAPESWGIDLLVTETMNHALTMEPQVAVTQNLAPQLLPHGILIPEQITLELAFSFFAKEPFLRGDTFDAIPFNPPVAYAARQMAGTLFTLDKELADCGTGSSFTSPSYAIPANYALYPDICILTTIRVFGDIELETAESYITNPYCVTSLYNLQGNPEFDLVYDFSETPDWTYNVIR